ncbi:hypothetical protein LUZ60_001433 [Juncus effusus]|nr:hypothetical protein LUZ60_001433 [Juncus effusus]
MDGNVKRLLNRVSLTFSIIATISLLHLFHHTSRSCYPSPTRLPRSSLTLSATPFPKSSCDAFSRRVTPPEYSFNKLRSTRSYLNRVNALSDSVFGPIRSMDLVSNFSHVLCVSSGAGHEVVALQDSGVIDVTGVDLIDFPPLVKRADPHNLPYFDEVFDLGFSTGLAGALFPARFVSELERTVRKGGTVALAVDKKVAEVEKVVELFKGSSLLEVRNVSLDGSQMNLIIMKNIGKN